MVGRLLHGAGRIVLWGGLWLAPQRASAQVISTIFPASGTGGPYVIVVLADGYTSQTQFKNDAAFIFLTRLMNDPFYLAHASSFTIKTMYRGASAVGSSLFGISTLNRPSCILSADPATTAQAINAAATLADPNPQFVAVLTNDSVSYGCTTADHWTYVTSGARRGVVPHELGHLIGGLYDEYDDGVAAYAGAAVNRSNCSTLLPPALPYWAALSLAPPPSNPLGCLYSVSGIVRPYPTCKMRDFDTNPLFCAVCRREMEAVLSPSPRGPVPTAPTGLKIIKAAFVQPTPAPIVNTAVRLVIRVDARTGQSTVLAANDVERPQIVQRRIGDVVYAVTENGQTLVTGVFPGDPFETRIYSGPGKHTNSEANAATVVVLVPQANVRSLLARSVQVTFYRIGTSDPDPVTPDKLRSLLQAGAARSISVLPPSVLNERLRALNR
jgi:hypothetical protein